MRRMVIAATIFALLMLALFGDRSFRSYWFNPSGEISEGAAFGVEIGASTREVVSAMAEGGFEQNDAICIDTTTSPPVQRFIESEDIETEVCDEIYLYHKDNGILFSGIVFSISRGYVQGISWKYSILNV